MLPAAWRGAITDLRNNRSQDRRQAGPTRKGRATQKSGRAAPPLRRQPLRREVEQQTAARAQRPDRIARIAPFPQAIPIARWRRRTDAVKACVWSRAPGPRRRRPTGDAVAPLAFRRAEQASIRHAPGPRVSRAYVVHVYCATPPPAPRIRLHRRAPREITRGATAPAVPGRICTSWGGRVMWLGGLHQSLVRAYTLI